MHGISRSTAPIRRRSENARWGHGDIRCCGRIEIGGAVHPLPQLVDKFGGYLFRPNSQTFCNFLTKEIAKVKNRVCHIYLLYPDGNKNGLILKAIFVNRCLWRSANASPTTAPV
jgi:hypothetical protein